MKRSDTLFRHKAKLLYDTGASIRELVYKITTITGSPVIDFSYWEDLGVCERVGTWVMLNDGETGYWVNISYIQRNAGSEDIYIVAETDEVKREEEMYDYTLDELIYLHDEVEKIYKFVSKGK